MLLCLPLSLFLSAYLVQHITDSPSSSSNYLLLSRLSSQILIVIIEPVPSCSSTLQPALIVRRRPANDETLWPRANGPAAQPDLFFLLIGWDLPTVSWPPLPGARCNQRPLRLPPLLR